MDQSARNLGREIGESGGLVVGAPNSMWLFAATGPTLLFSYRRRSGECRLDCAHGPSIARS
ncbi:protein of unknown function [Nitrospira defluvii]|uniref:Uncharacterized protein n=1 Tax=Nitrospira defluvii TaxID=330214 RepID=D8PAY0_9BACT|nr:protein of unknown function [Nitrospira defluvii]